MRRLAIFAAVVLAAPLVIGACTDGSAPVGSGDRLIDDSHHAADPLPPPPPPPDEAGADATYSDAGKPQLDTCAGCTCAPDQSFCFAGGVHLAGMADAPPPACSIADAGRTVLGCNTLPSKCAANPDCVCILDAIQPEFACYLVCTPDNGYFLVYCPTP